MLRKFGKVNFFISLGMSSGAIISTFLYPKIGFTLLIGLEAIVNTVALILAFMLPNIASFKKTPSSLKEKYVDAYQIAKKLISNPSLFSYILYAGMTVGISTLFLWSFQPLMKLSHVSIYFFGIVTCINNFVRSLAGMFIEKVNKLLGVKKLVSSIYSSFIICFFGILTIIRYENPIVCLMVLFFIIMAVSLQFLFNMTVTVAIHKHVTADIRSTSVSINNIIARSIGAFSLFIFKILLDFYSMTMVYFTYGVVFTCIGALMVRKIYLLKEV